MERSPKEKADGLDSSFTFQPVVGSNSSKIVAKLKTGFWERQKLHVKRQKQKVSFRFFCHFILAATLCLSFVFRPVAQVDRAPVS